MTFLYGHYKVLNYICVLCYILIRQLFRCYNAYFVEADKSFLDNKCDNISLIIQYVFYTWMLIEHDSNLPMNEYIEKS